MPKKTTKPHVRSKKSVTKKGSTKSLARPLFTRVYAFIALAILAGTTIYWAILGARLHSSNSDQLVNSLLFQDSSTFHQAVFPGQHTFLLKWPIFFLIKLIGFSDATFITFTVITALLTVLILAAIIYRIERRPLIFGTLYLALASILLLVPPMPYGGGLLPINMAMIATRNLEYLFYLLSLGLLLTAARLKSWRFVSGVIVLALLLASDKLFLSLSVGGALIALIIYILFRSWKSARLSVNWLIGGLVATIGAIAILRLVNNMVANLSTQAGLGPYGLINNHHALLSGIKYAFLGILTNFGANASYGAAPSNGGWHQLISGLISWRGIGYAINGCTLVFGLWAIWKLIKYTLNRRQKIDRLDDASKLSIALIWSSLAAILLFVISNHYYPVDARYLGIALFALFITVAAFTRQKTWSPRLVLLSGLLILGSITIGLFTAHSVYSRDRSALAPIDHRNQLVAQILKSHPVDTLVGDYWRVLPIKLSNKNNVNIMPLAGCIQPRAVLTSIKWQPNLNHVSFAYLLSFDKGLTDYPACKLKQIVAEYGRPNASSLIAGTLKQPKESLLFYDHGIHKSAPVTPPPPQGPSTVVPISLGQLPHTACQSRTIMNIVAHQDDDLLFTSPDLIHDIKEGHCIRTVYVTAGDAGNEIYYWLGREKGSEAAYAKMADLKDIIWVHRIVELPGGQFIDVDNPRGNSQISLIFMHLPDGGLKGEGFKRSNYESLAALGSGKISLMHGVDAQSRYTADQLIEALADIIQTFTPSEIRTQANYISSIYPDHSDHMAVGRFVKKAYAQYETRQDSNQISIPLVFYNGYPVHAMLSNVSGADLQAKEDAFLEYAKFDGGVCQSVQQCSNTRTYNSYLQREYTNPY